MEQIQEPVVFFLVIMTIILVMPLLSERFKLPGIVGVIIGGIIIGPFGIHLLPVNDRIEFLAAIGLVYLMFSAGLELDFHMFMRVRKKALVFGTLTFLIPQLFGMGLGWLIGLPLLGIVLLGSAFASHTLLAFPILNQLGVTRNEAVAVTAGATILTDIGAFIILAIVLGAKQDQLEVLNFVKLLSLLIIFTLFIFLALPKLGKWFFQRFKGRAVEFQFVIVILFVAAFGAKLIGVHEVVGAFMAGLAISAMLPRHSPVTGHVLFLGESFFIPIFLLYSGMITDPFTLFKDSKTVLFAVGILAVAYLSKLLAAWITAKLFKYSRAEFWTAYGLSHAQAAVTIPTLVIGLQNGWFDTTLFNAAIVMILFTSITSPLLVQRFGSKLKTNDYETIQPLFSKILVPISYPNTQENLLTLASLLAKTSNGKVVAANVVLDSKNIETDHHHQKELLERVEQTMIDLEANYELVPRIANSYSQGILQTSKEHESSLILMGWRGKRAVKQNVLGTVLDEVIWGSDMPVMICKLNYPVIGVERILLLIPARTLVPAALRRFLNAVVNVAKGVNVKFDILTDKSYLDLIHDVLKNAHREHIGDISEMIGFLRPDELKADPRKDLIIVPGFGSRQRFLSNLGNLPERLAESFDGNMIILHFDR